MNKTGLALLIVLSLSLLFLLSRIDEKLKHANTVLDRFGLIVEQAAFQE